MKTALITGAGGALGSAVTDYFSRQGWRLYLIDRHDGENAANITRIPVDLTDFDAVKAAFGQLPSPDALINIAGGFGMEDSAGADPSLARKMMAINYFTLFNSCSVTLPRMIERGTGFICGISAAAAEGGAAQMAAYAASKAAVANYLGSIQKEYHKKGIRVSTVYPIGAIDTPGNRAAMPGTDPQKWIDPHQIAEAIHFLATRDRRGHLNELKIEVS